MPKLNNFGDFSFLFSNIPGNSLSGSPTENKAKFDIHGNELKIYIQDLVSILNSLDGANYLTAKGKNNIETTVQSILTDLINGKVDIDGNFTGTWNGLRPTQTNEFIQSQVDSNTTQLADVRNSILNWGGSDDGITPNDLAWGHAKYNSRKGNGTTDQQSVHFPNNVNGNAVYYFTNTPNLDYVYISADKGVKLSFPTTNGVSFKNAILKNDISIISRDRNNTGAMYANDYSKSIFSSLIDNDIEIGLKRPQFKDGTNFNYTNYFNDGSATTAGSVGYYDANLKDTFKSSDTTSGTNTGKYLISEIACNIGYIYNCVFKTINTEINTDVRAMILCAIDNNHFISYGIDINKNLYTGLRNNGWTETANTKFQTKFTDAYSIKDNVVMSVRVASLSRLEFYINGVLTDCIDLPFNIQKVGFGINFVNAAGSGVNNIYWGKITFGECLKANIGDSINAAAFGDSVTFGEGTISWAEHLPKMLEGQRGINKFTITNKAVSGNTSAQQLAIMQATDLTPYDLILILIGINDIQGNVPISTFSANLQAMIDLAKGNNRKVVVGVPHVWISQDLTGQGFATSNYNKGGLYRAEIIKLVAVNNIILADTMSEIGRVGVDNHLAVIRDNLHNNHFGEILDARAFARGIICAYTQDTQGYQTTPKYTYPTPINGYYVYNVGQYNSPLRATRDGLTLYIYGFLTPGTFTNGTTIFVLPVGFRPTAPRIIDALSNLGPWTAEIQTNGNVVVSTPTSGTPSWIEFKDSHCRLD